MLGLMVLSALRINAIMAALQDQRELPAELKFLNRTAVVNATDGEILGRFVGRTQIADIVSDDQKAAVYAAGRLNYETTAIPNLKHGANVNQEMLNQLAAFIESGKDIRGIADTPYGAYEMYTMDSLLLGVRQRMEALIIAMQLDGMVYDRLGIKITGTFGMPSDLKITVSTPWDNVNATPVSDLLLAKLIGRIRYGIIFDRVTMGTTAFRYMVATTEFQNKARTFLAPNVSFTNINIQNLEQMAVLAGNVLGIDIELYDARYWSQNENGSLTSAPFLPIVNTILSSKADDNNPAAMDFANAIVTEAIVAKITQTNMVGTLNQMYGPVGYATAPPDLNPPAVTYWGVGRGFPRKKRLQSTAALTVGSFVDTIGVGEPF